MIAVVYESLFGNTHEVANAIAEGVAEARPDVTVICLSVENAAPDRVAAADMLFVGGPTHMRGMSSRLSRRMGLQTEAKKRTEPTDMTGREPERGDTAGREAESGDTAGDEPEPGAEGPGLRDWFHQLPKAPKGRSAAAFDTRGAQRMAGGAASGIAHRLHRHGYELVGEEGFIIEDAEGPLRAGERDRARAWAADLVRRLASSEPAR